MGSCSIFTKKNDIAFCILNKPREERHGLWNAKALVSDKTRLYAFFFCGYLLLPFWNKEGMRQACDTQTNTNCSHNNLVVLIFFKSLTILFALIMLIIVSLNKRFTRGSLSTNNERLFPRQIFKNNAFKEENYMGGHWGGINLRCCLSVCVILD